MQIYRIDKSLVYIKLKFRSKKHNQDN